MGPRRSFAVLFFLVLLSITIYPVFAAGLPAPVVGFYGTPTSGTAPLDVSFTDLSSGGSPTGWAWFFGDETYSAPWTQVNANVGWSGRLQSSSVAMPDGSIVMIGGCR